MKKILSFLIVFLMLVFIVSSTVSAKNNVSKIEKTKWFWDGDATLICILVGLMLLPGFIFCTMAAFLGFFLQIPNHIIRAYTSLTNGEENLGFVQKIMWIASAIITGFLSAREVYFGEGSPWADSLDQIMDLLMGHSPGFDFNGDLFKK